jgi:hypothetical protein
MIKILTNILSGISENLNKLTNYLNREHSLKLISLSYTNSGRFLIYHFNNESLKTHRDILFNIYTFLMNNDRFINFGFNKVIITSSVINGSEYSYHHNILLTNKTTFNEYFNQVIDYIDLHYSEDSDCSPGVEIPQAFKVKVWNMDNYLNKKIKIHRNDFNKDIQINISNKPKVSNKNSPINDTITIQKRGYSTTHNISPIKNNIVTGIPEPIAATDIETIDYNGNQIPISVTISYLDTGNQIINKFILIDFNLLLKDKDLALTKLWFDYLTYITKNNITNIFAHNLGKFDGYFIYKGLSEQMEPKFVNTIIDHQNRFITINMKTKLNKIKWLDSKRIFPVSLNDLCEVFNVEGKFNKYNVKFNTLDLFKDAKLLNEFEKYAIQDSVALLNALLKAQEIYLRDFNIDITSIVSTSSLSLKIFKTKFLDVDIPILKGSTDKFIRKSYFGGGTDYYKGYGENLYYYDVNSLYPYSMMKPMPFKLIKHHNNLNIELKVNTNLFGFFEAECFVPNNGRPMLPYKHEGKTIYPYGKWKGIYYTEEMKALLEYGYQFKILRGCEFSKIFLFNKYVDYFYNKKKTSKGASRFIAKMHLNQLYGIFGRKQDVIETINIYNVDIEKYLLSRVIKTIIEINNEKSCLLLQSNLDNDIISKLNLELDINLNNSSQFEVKSNVALAAAVTSYSRIHMLPFKMSKDVLYTDTDSIFTSKKLDDKLVGKDLGLMKAELDGNIIEEAHFLGIKQYGYTYRDMVNGNIYQYINNSVFAGVPRDTITWPEVKALFSGKTIKKEIPLRFYKSFKDLSINIKSNINLVLTRSNDKKLVNNQYIPMSIDNLNHDNMTFFNKLKNKILKLLKYFNIKPK